jgi:Flp pilus assembly protein TadG
MRKFAEKILARVRGFRRDDDATAIVEFALVVPFMLILYMGTIEISDLTAVDRRVNVISGTVGDLIAREDGCISSSTLTEYFKASEGIITPYSKTGVKQVATLLAVSAGGTATVSWSQAYNGGTAKTTSSVYALPAAMVDISKGKWVVMSETSYSYKPMLGWVVQSAINLRRISYYMPRGGTTITYTNGTCA